MIGDPVAIPGAESIERRLREIVDGYWRSVKNIGASDYRRAEAIAQIRALPLIHPFTEGDAERWLSTPRRRP